MWVLYLGSLLISSFRTCPGVRVLMLSDFCLSRWELVLMILAVVRLMRASRLLLCGIDGFS